ncbi:MAG TPA: hypothetical protein H9915_00960 [Candidatus Gemmiger faecigallinarum]|nr:hypothetical protein [Candidatus Gemmiger faecigallinarum]
MIDLMLKKILSDQVVYICAPLRDCIDCKMIDNQKRAQRYGADIMELYECKTVAPQAYLPELLDLDDPSQYGLSLRFRAQLMDFCNILLVCGETLTSEMQQELLLAVGKGLLIVSQPENAALVHSFLLNRGLSPEVGV